MSTFAEHEAEQAEITAAYMARRAQFDPGEAKAPKPFYVSLTWDDWPEGGSYGTVVQADDDGQAVAMAKLEMAEIRAEGGDAESEDSDPLYWLEAYADSDWHVVDCFEVAEFIARHTPKPMWVAFRTVGHSFAAPDLTRPGDEYEICETEAEARDRLDQWRADGDTSCAGIAPIADATEPHWKESQP